MKIIFIIPNMSWLYDYKSQFPLSILYLSTILKELGCEVKIFDTNINNIEDIEIADVYGFSVVYNTYQDSIRLCKILKNIRPNAQCIVGGVAVTLDPDNVDEAFDSFFIGEAEDTIKEYIEDFKNNNVKKLYNQGYESDINSVFPDRKLVTDDYIRTSSIFAYGKEYAPGGCSSIIFSRGCPYKCAFCASSKVWNRRVRFRSVDNIVQEIKYMINEYGIRQFRIQDDTFTLDPNYLKELCNALEPLNIYYRCSTRVNHIKENTIELLYKSGCREIGIGVEVADNDILKKLNKGITVEDIERAIYLIRQFPITLRTFFLVGLPYDSYESYQKNMDFLDRTNSEFCMPSNFVPFPGTDMYENMEKYNIREILPDTCLSVGQHIPLRPNILRYDISLEEHTKIMKTFFDYMIKKKFI